MDRTSLAGLGHIRSASEAAFPAGPGSASEPSLVVVVRTRQRHRAGPSPGARVIIPSARGRDVMPSREKPRCRPSSQHNSRVGNNSNVPEFRITGVRPRERPKVAWNARSCDSLAASSVPRSHVYEAVVDTPLPFGSMTRTPHPRSPSAGTPLTISGRLTSDVCTTIGERHSEPVCRSARSPADFG